jgi:hypothetical protein
MLAVGVGNLLSQYQHLVFLWIGEAIEVIKIRSTCKTTCRENQDELIALLVNAFASVRLYGFVIIISDFDEFWRKEEISRERNEECFWFAWVVHPVELKISFARVSRKEKSCRSVGLALLVLVGNDVFLTPHLSQLKEDGLGSNVLPRTSFCS